MKRYKKTSYGIINPVTRVFTSYNEDDIKELETTLLYHVTHNATLLEEDLYPMITTYAKKAIRQSGTKILTKGYNTGFYKVGFKQASLSNSDINKLVDDILQRIKSFKQDYKKAKASPDFNIDIFKNRAFIIAKSSIASLTNNANAKIAQNMGAKEWVWGVTSSKNPRSSHEILVGRRSPIGKTPAKGGEFPAELPNCKCMMIFDIPKNYNQQSLI